MEMSGARDERPEPAAAGDPIPRVIDAPDLIGSRSAAASVRRAVSRRAADPAR
jgi:hypothetical protein